MVLFFGTLLPAIAQVETTRITVRLFNRSRVAASVLAEGERQASEILQRAEIRLDWLNCQHGTQECIQQPTSTNFILTVLKTGSKMASQDVLGMAVQDASGTGAYCYVFEDKLNEVSAQMHIAVARLLAYAMAHEIGHLLKGSRSHSPSGIMSALWSSKELHQLALGTFSFTEGDVEIMRSRLNRLSQPQDSMAKLDANR
jgi:hypothetical protein